MSLLLEQGSTPPDLEAKATGFVRGNPIFLYGTGVHAEISLEDFCVLTYYVLTNSDLMPEDPRLNLIERIKKLQITEGFNPGESRLEIQPKLR